MDTAVCVCVCVGVGVGVGVWVICTLMYVCAMALS